MNYYLKEPQKKKDAGVRPDEKKEGRKPLTQAQRIRRNKMIVFPAMGLLFLGSMWLIFAPSAEEREKAKAGQGFNTEMPLPENGGIIGDKKKAYELAQLEDRRQNRNRQLHDLASLFEGERDSMPAAQDEAYSLLPGEERSGTGARRRYIPPPRHTGTSTARWDGSMRSRKRTARRKNCSGASKSWKHSRRHARTARRALTSRWH